MTPKPSILLMPQGSAGDVHPFVGIGLELQKRGHDVTLATNDHFRGLAEKVGLPFMEIGTSELFEEVTQNPDLWAPTIKSTRLVFGMSAQVMPQQYDLIKQAYAKEPSAIVVAGPLAFGARVASEKLGIKHVTLQLAPAVFLSPQKPARLPGLILPSWLPLWFKKSVLQVASMMVDRIVAQPINAFRCEIGLTTPMRHVLHWWNSPALTVGMFPKWFAQPASDWPASVQLSSFGLYDESQDRELPDAVTAFLEAGDKPVVFTPGSANVHARDFFEQSVQACTLSGRRGILLSRYAENIPSHLPDGVVHFEYVPLSLLLPRCRALVYHGGIGTLSQACKAGIPHLVMKLSHDQFDNAKRLETLRLGLSVKPEKYKAKRIAMMLNRLIDDLQVQKKCQQIALKMQAENGIARTCDLIEKISGKQDGYVSNWRAH